MTSGREMARIYATVMMSVKTLDALDKKGKTYYEDFLTQQWVEFTGPDNALISRLLVEFIEKGLRDQAEAFIFLNLYFVHRGNTKVMLESIRELLKTLCISPNPQQMLDELEVISDKAVKRCIDNLKEPQAYDPTAHKEIS